MTESESIQFFGGEVQSPLPSLPQLQILILDRKHPEECAWSDYFDNFEKSEREYLLSKQQIYSM